MPAYSIISERPIDGFDLFGKGEAVALASDLLDQFAEDAGVRPLLDFFSMDPAEVDALFDGLNLEAAPELTDAPTPDAEIPTLEEAPLEEWFDPHEGLTTIRALIQAIEDQPTPEVPDPFDPHPEAVLADLREFETILDHLADEGVRWHLSVNF